MAKIEGEVKREKHTIEMEALVCDSCGHVALEGADAQEFMRLLADAYRQAHGLLTSREIRNIRGRLSQQRFADELGVGVASIKRWELGMIQDRRSNRQILEFAEHARPTWAYSFESERQVSWCNAEAVGREGLANGPPVFAGASDLLSSSSSLHPS